ncbi:unnamed protein product [Pleuronectes platessa]|uniref:Uncharacterized protein n=1 Tax=Pleuronectes platessa TaxID=8262 RepID=A0A9N7YFS7_PLEPL|nr:unnamed protein product [Pleuronectes platessa]
MGLKVVPWPRPGAAAGGGPGIEPGHLKSVLPVICRPAVCEVCSWLLPARPLRSFKESWNTSAIFHQETRGMQEMKPPPAGQMLLLRLLPVGLQSDVDSRDMNHVLKQVHVDELLTAGGPLRAELEDAALCCPLLPSAAQLPQVAPDT